MRVLAAEEPEVRVVSYSPGPVETAMTNEIKQNSCNSQIIEQFEKGNEKVIRAVRSYSFFNNCRNWTVDVWTDSEKANKNYKWK